MRLAFYENAQDTRPRVERYEWPALAELLTSFRHSSACTESPCQNRRCPGKNGSAWSPVDIEGTRSNANVRAITAAVFDLDHLEVSQLSLLEALRGRGLAFVAHSTHSHAPPSDCCLRLVLPLSRAVLPHEWPTVRARAVAALELPADPSTKDLSRIYYLPDAPSGTQPVAETNDGDALDVYALLRGAPVAARDTSFDVEMLEAQPAAVDLHELADRLVAHCRPENRVLVRASLRGEPLPHGRHDDSLQRLMSLAAFVLPEGTPEEAVVELFRDSWAATPWREGVEHLAGEALKKLRRARERRRERDAARAAQDALVVDRLRAKLARPAPSSAVPREDDDEGVEEWASSLILSSGKRWRDLEPGERPAFKNNGQNVYAVLRHSPEWRGRIRFNDVEKEICVEDSPLGENVSTETLDAAVSVWFSTSHWGDCGLLPSPTTVREMLLLVAQRNAFDPLREYLTSLEWDGTSRLESFFQTYFGAEDSAYTRAVSSKWLLSGVARALDPGCKMDTVLVLEGAQGIGKSRAFGILGGHWFTDTPISTRDKDSRLLAARAWMVELSESTIFASVENEELKAFFSSSEDLIRPPFGKTHQRYKRRAVFAGTTNAAQYLRRDTTGSRRFWPIRCEHVDLDALKRDKPQLLAEAVARFNKGEEWWLTREEQALANEVVSSRLRSEGESFPELIRQWFLRMAPNERPDALHIAEVADKALGIQPHQMGRDLEMRVATALHELDFENRIRVSNGARRRVWEAPDNLLRAPQIVTDSSDDGDNVRPLRGGRR